MLINIQNPNQFVILRDGQLDEAYTAELIAQERRQALQEAAGQAIRFTMQRGLALARSAGTALLDRLDEAIESVA